MRSDVPKVFLKLGGTPILEHTLKALSLVEQINEAVVVVSQDSVGRLRRLLAETEAWPFPGDNSGSDRCNDSEMPGWFWVPAIWG